MVLNIDLNMVFNVIFNVVLNMIFSMVLNMVLNMGLNMILNGVLNMNSSRNTNLISTKQFVSFNFYITSFSRLVLHFSLRSSFIRVNASNSNKISEYSSSEIESSDYAFEMRLLIVLSTKTAKIAIYSCF